MATRRPRNSTRSSEDRSRSHSPLPHRSCQIPRCTNRFRTNLTSMLPLRSGGYTHARTSCSSTRRRSDWSRNRSSGWSHNHRSRYCTQSRTNSKRKSSRRWREQDTPCRIHRSSQCRLLVSRTTTHTATAPQSKRSYPSNKSAPVHRMSNMSRSDCGPYENLPRTRSMRLRRNRRIQPCMTKERSSQTNRRTPRSGRYKLLNSPRNDDRLMSSQSRTRWKLFRRNPRTRSRTKCDTCRLRRLAYRVLCYTNFRKPSSSMGQYQGWFHNRSTRRGHSQTKGTRNQTGRTN